MINQWYPVGTAVIYTEDDGSEFITSTRSMAWVAGSKPVVKINGRVGWHDISRIKVLDAIKVLKMFVSIHDKTGFADVNPAYAVALARQIIEANQL